MDVIRTEHLTKIFAGRQIAVSNLNLTVGERAIYGFLGPNGAGKTTTIRLILGLLKPTAGKAIVFGEEMMFNSSELRKRIGYLPTAPKFPPQMTPIEYLDFVGRIFGIPSEERTPRLTKLIRAVDLFSDASKEVKSFSTGMTTRLGVAAALMNDPELLILDEPTSGLDPSGRRSMLELMKDLGREKTVFISSHILSEVDRVCTHVGVVDQGKLIYSGPIDEMKNFIRSNLVSVELEGDVDGFLSQLKDLQFVATYERLGNEVNIHFQPGVSTLEMVSSLVQLLFKSRVELVSIKTSENRMEEAFIKLLEEEKSSGFLRAVRA